MNSFKKVLEGVSKDPSADVQSYSKLDCLEAGAISYASPMGCINIVAADQHKVSHVFFTEHFPFDDAEHLYRQYPVLTRVRELLARYFASEPINVCEIPIQVDTGTPFQKEVWHIIQQIPYGEVQSYQWIAEQIGKPKAVRAVGNAVGANPVAILRPCHRVIRSNGALGGYGGGLERKRQLLALEGHDIEKFK